MKRINNLTEEQAVAIAALLVTYRAVREVKVVRDRKEESVTGRYGIFAVVVETYSAEETAGKVSL